MSEKLWYLKSCELFRRLTTDELSRLESCSRARSFPKKSPIYLPADGADAVFLVAEGRVKICHLTPEGKQAILAFIEPGELFGELAVFDEGDRDEYAEALEKSMVIMIPRDQMQAVMQSRPDVSLGVTKLIGLRRKRIERRLKNLLFLSNRERLTHLLLELAEQYGRPVDGGVQLGIKLSHQDLANVIGSTRETVTVVLGEMQNEGLIEVGRRKIILTRSEHLAQSVHCEAPHPGAAAVRPANMPLSG